MPNHKGRLVAVVTGDVTIDWNLAYLQPKGQRTHVIWSPDDQGCLSWQRGGAAMLADVIDNVSKLEEVKKQADFHVLKVEAPKIGGELSPSSKDHHHSFALWGRDEPDKRFDPSPVWSQEKGDEEYDKRWVWRVKRYLGFEHNGDQALKHIDTEGINQNECTAEVIVLDDLGFGFRNKEKEKDNFWPKELFNEELLKSESAAPWVVLQTSRILDEGRNPGALLRYLLEKCPKRLIVVLTIDELRSAAQVRIPPGLSWERTAEDLARGLQNDEFLKCRHVVVSLGTVGAALLSRSEDLGSSTFDLFYAPRFMETEWELPSWGWMLGNTVTLTASLVHQVMINLGTPNLEAGIGAGVTAMRELYLSGYRCLCTTCNDSDSPGYCYQLKPSAEHPLHPPALIFPAEEVAKCLRAPKQSSSIIASEELAKISVGAQIVRSPDRTIVDVLTVGSPDWTILDGLLRKATQGQPSYGAWLSQAEDIVKNGISNRDIPMGRFGDLSTVDRLELEALRSIQGLIREYARYPMLKSPLNLAVFGPPGSGKSFAVEQVADSVFRSSGTEQAADGVSRDVEIETIKFNLSQFADPAAIPAALHRVHDIALSGKLPLVFWDEFDTQLDNQNLGWLRFFLAPMQDGEFVEAQITHPIGRCIFVFAGGTCSRRMEFEEQGTPEDRRASKVPDFISRLHGCLDVFGINMKDDKPNVPPHFLIRRAVLLRSLLHKREKRLFKEREVDERKIHFIPGRTSRGILEIDDGVLRAFLETKEYKHGSRSMKAIVDLSTLANKERFDRSSLPSKILLSLHVDADDFEEKLF
jgi:hypothetical protein